MRLALNAILLMLVLAPIAHADKTTTDPNTVKPPVPEKIADKRLDQKVTYESLDKRLHTVLDELSAKTGVAVRCGDGKNDWQVRDLPLVVCARDLPLGTLLRAIADSTHLLMSSYVNDDGVRTYRIWRDKTRKKQIEDNKAQSKAWARARVEWLWDTWAQLGRTPGIEAMGAGMDFSDQGFDLKSAAAFARVVASLDPEARETALRDGEVRLNPESQPPAMASALSDLYRVSHEALQRRQRKDRQKMAARSPDAYAECYPSGEPEDLPFSGACARNTSLAIMVSPDEWGTLEPRLIGPCDSPYVPTGIPWGWVKKCLKDWPDSPRQPDPVEDAHDAGLAEPDWSSPLMQTKLKIEKPKDKPMPTFADGLSLTSRAAGISIVSEDFRSHKNAYHNLLDRLYLGIETCNAIRNLTGGQYSWRLDEESKLMVGSAYEWWLCHERLVPESFISGLLNKLNSDGIDLDDALSTLRLTDGQRSEWLSASRELQDVNWIPSEADAPFWRFYDSLSPADKAQAKSDDGLRLAKSDPDIVTAVFRASAKAEQRMDPREVYGRVMESNFALRQAVMAEMRARVPNSGASSPSAADLAEFQEVQAGIAEKFPELAGGTVPTDAETILAMTLRIRSQDSQPYVKIDDTSPASYGYHIDYREDGFRKRSYYMTLEGNGKSLVVNGHCTGEYPIYSPEREKQLWEDKQKAAEKDKANAAK